MPAQAKTGILGELVQDLPIVVGHEKDENGGEKGEELEKDGPVIVDVEAVEFGVISGGGDRKVKGNQHEDEPADGDSPDQFLA